MAKKEFATLLPINAMMGWTEGVESKHDAVEMAKGFISRRYTAVDSSWYAVAPFMGGYLWEVHEGGPGKGYIGSAVKALSENPGSKFWFPSADRAFQVMMRDGKPFGILLSRNESLPVINSDQPPLGMVTKMQPAVRKGTAVFAAGAAFMASGALFMAAAGGFWFVAANPAPSLPNLALEKLPHAQWTMVEPTGVEQIVSKLQFSNGKWDVTTRPHVIPGLKELRDETQQSLQRARDSIPPPSEQPPPEDSESPPAQPVSPMPAPAGEGTIQQQIPGFDQMSPLEKTNAIREQAMRRQGIAVKPPTQAMPQPDPASPPSPAPNLSLPNAPSSTNLPADQMPSLPPAPIPAPVPVPGDISGNKAPPPSSEAPQR